MIFSDITRKQAFLTHLLASACVFAIISYLIVFHWFPDFYFFLDGGIRAITTIFFVDVVLGPGLTLLVFKPGKKTLKFDMTVILLMQFSALVWGVTSVYAERPGATVFYWGKFACISNNDTGEMDMTAITAGPSSRQRLSFLQRPDNIEDFQNFMTEAFEHQSAEIYYYGEKIVPLDALVVARLQNYKLDVSQLAIENEASSKLVENYLNRHEADLEHINLIPLSCRYGSAIAVYDEHELKITDWLEVKTKLRAVAQDESMPDKQPLDMADGNDS